MSTEMNKSPMEVRLEEMAEEHLKMLVPQDSPLNMRAREFKAGFKAALELPEIKQLVTALEKVGAYFDCQMCEGDVDFVCDHHLEIRMQVAIEALKAWREFTSKEGE